MNTGPDRARAWALQQREAVTVVSSETPNGRIAGSAVVPDKVVAGLPDTFVMLDSKNVADPSIAAAL